MNNHLKVLTIFLVTVCKTNQDLAPNPTNEAVLKIVENEYFANFQSTVDNYIKKYKINKNEKQINPTEGKSDNNKMSMELESVNQIHQWYKHGLEEAQQ